MANNSAPTGDSGGIDWSSLGGSAGGAAGTAAASAATDPQKKKIYDNLVAQYAAAQGIDVSRVGATDPRLRQAQMKALTQLQGLSDANGLDPQARAMEAQGQRDSAEFEKGQRGAILNDAQARGVGGGGAELAAQLQAQQAGANRSAIVGQQSAAAARARALQAMSEYSALAGGIRNQDEGDAKDSFGANMAKYGASRDARQGINSYYGADRAEKIGNGAAGGQAAGQVLGSLGQAASNAGSRGGGNQGGGSQGGSSGNSGNETMTPMPDQNTSGGGTDTGGWNQYPAPTPDNGDIGGDGHFGSGGGGGGGGGEDPYGTPPTDPGSPLARRQRNRTGRY